MKANKIQILSYFSVVTAVVLFFGGCASNPYAITNKAYKTQVKELAKTINQVPLETAGQITDKNSWVGTTNFGLRKPNYVIIHHTAQKLNRANFKKLLRCPERR